MVSGHLPCFEPQKTPRQKARSPEHEPFWGASFGASFHQQQWGCLIRVVLLARTEGARRTKDALERGVEPRCFHSRVFVEFPTGSCTSQCAGVSGWTLHLEG